MTIEEKRKMLLVYCRERACNNCKLSKVNENGEKENCNIGTKSKEEINKQYALVFGGSEQKTETINCCIKDSGERRKFETGAVRDIQKGKGRCDLLPLQEIGILFENKAEVLNILFFIGEYQKTNDILYLFKAIQEFIKIHYVSIPTCCLELSKHFEEGAKKYGENNWQKGIPKHCYIDSAVRHFLKFLRGDSDEPHDRAFVWNLLCCIWTCKNKPKMNDYEPKKESDSTNDK